jgi:hypothetical protein
VLPRNRNRPIVALPPLNSGSAARIREDPPYVPRPVGEHVSRVLVALTACCRRVPEATAVRVNEPPKEELRLPFDCDPPLPGLERDLPLMLPRCPVLWEDARPMLGIRREFLAPDSRYIANLTRNNPAHSDGTLANEIRILDILNDPQSVDAPRMAHDVSVAEIKAQEIGVCRLGQVPHVVAELAGPSVVMGARVDDVVEALRRPVPHGRAANADPTGDLCDGQPQGEKAPNRCDVARRSARAYQTDVRSAPGMSGRANTVTL